MNHAVLLSQCLQNDFVKPLEPHDPLPNALHIGYNEARRLMGTSRLDGPLGRFMRWAHEQAGEALSVIHIRDFHDPSDPRQQSHLLQFGEHCIAGSKGADFVFDWRPELASVINATTLNDFDDTQLQRLLDPLVASGKPLKIGIVGVWTEAKVTFLAYELCTRYPEVELAVCSALCASSSRAEHYHALEQLSRILGVTVFSSVGTFSEWLLNQRLELPLPAGDEGRPRLVFSKLPEPALNAEDERLLRYLFRDCQRVDLDLLDGGFSGNVVMGALGIDRDGHEQVPHVVKIGAQDAIGRERAHFERIESVLGNSAPQIADFADFGSRGALKYRYASMGGGFSTTFQKQYQSGLGHDEVERVLRAVFEDQLGRLYAAARRERCNLLRHYGFDPKWAQSVHQQVQALTGENTSQELLKWQFGPEQSPRMLYNLCRFYDQRLMALPRDEREAAYFGTVHGDLNGANIVVDRQRNVWLIDFFHTRRAHVLMDLIKLENDLLYIMTPISDLATLNEATAFTDALLEVSDLGSKLPEAAPVSGLAFERAWRTLRLLRSFYPQLVRSDRSPLQLLVGQLRYAVHTLSFDEASRLQKAWALYAACSIAGKIDDYYTKREQLRVDWLPDEYTKPGRIGLTILPGRRDRLRDLSRDLDALEHAATTHVLCLLSEDELRAYGVPEALAAYQQRQFTIKQLPIVDQGVCTVEQMREAVRWMEDAVRAGGRVVVHCVGGLGRSGLAVAAFLREQGLDSARALAVVRAARSPRAVETALQEDFVARYCAG